MLTMKMTFFLGAAVLLAGVCSAGRSSATGMSASQAGKPDAGNRDVVKELFPWFEIGEKVDAAKLKGLKHLNSFAARPDLRAREEYLIVDAGMPTNHAAWVTLSAPDRKVLQMRHDIGCGTVEAARKLAGELLAKFKPLELAGRGELLEEARVMIGRALNGRFRLVRFVRMRCGGG